MRYGILFGGALAFCLAMSGCSDDVTAPARDGLASDGGAGDAPADGTTASGDGSIGEANKPTELGGWIPTEGGPIVVHDGGIVITEDGGTIMVCYVTSCAEHLTACGDCIDNDGDGKTDWRDPECLGPCDNTEGPALISGVGGVTGSTCHVDCYFDYGNGMGDDDCWWDHQCDPLEPEAPSCLYNDKLVGTKNCPVQQSQACVDNCLPYTPNGCDCFGCCTFPQLKGKGANGADLYVWIGAKDAQNNGTCTFADIEDPAKCPLCTANQACLNECGPCEVCVGRPVPPDECYQPPPVAVDGGGPVPDAYIPPPQCPGGEQPCGLPGQLPCDPGFYYCISGCCIELQID